MCAIIYYPASALRQLDVLFFTYLPHSHPRLATPAATHGSHCRPSGASLSPSPHILINKGKKKVSKGKETKEKCIPPSSPSTPQPSTSSGHSAISSSQPPDSSSTQARVIILPTSVSLRKHSTAGIVLLSWKRSLTAGARGCFHSQAFPISFHSFLAWGAQARHFAKRWCRDRCSPLLNHQKFLDRTSFILSLGYRPITACPERSW